METHLPRSEIVRLVRSLLGIQTTSGLAVQTLEQHIAAVQLAAQDVAVDCRWVNPQARATVTLGAQQDTLDYPEGGFAGSILSLSVWQTNRYVPLEQRIIPASLDTDQQLAEGGAALTAVCSLPRFFEQRAQIKLFPRSDQAYPVRIEYMQPMGLPLDSSVSKVDAQLIVYRAASLISKQQENDTGAEYYLGLYAKRLGDLRAWQSAGSDFALSSEADLGEGEFSLEQYRPNWNTAPTPPVT